MSVKHTIHAFCVLQIILYMLWDHHDYMNCDVTRITITQGRYEHQSAVTYKYKR